MDYEQWDESGRPHWQCVVCERIMITVPVVDDFICQACATDSMIQIVRTQSTEQLLTDLTDYEKDPDSCLATEVRRKIRLVLKGRRIIL